MHTSVQATAKSISLHSGKRKVVKSKYIIAIHQYFSLFTHPLAPSIASISMPVLCVTLHSHSTLFTSRTMCIDSSNIHPHTPLPLTVHYYVALMVP